MGRAEGCYHVGRSFRRGDSALGEAAVVLAPPPSASRLKGAKWPLEGDEPHGKLHLNKAVGTERMGPVAAHPYQNMPLRNKKGMSYQCTMQLGGSSSALSA